MELFSVREQWRLKRRQRVGSRQEDHPPLIPAPRQNQGIPEQDG